MTGAGARTGWGPRLTPPRGPGYMAPSSRGGRRTPEDAGGGGPRGRALLQAEKMETIGRLTGAIAQQFSELLGAILQRAAALAQSSPPSRDLDELKETAQRGAELAHKLLGFSRHKTLDLQPLSLTEYVREILDTLRRELPGNIEVQFEADEVGGVVEADPAEVRQILMSLVTNARDAMSKGGTLHVEVRRARLGAADRPLHAWIEPGSYVSVAVSDTGTGMNAATLARVFEPFFTTKPLGIGTGLGMAMVYGLVKQHKGFVHLYSEIGQGTTAKVYLPAVYHRAPPLEAVDDEILPGGTETILLVEDDPTMRSVAQELLEKVGYRVLAAVDGAQGLTMYRAHRAELRLVLTDVIMPKLSGFQLYEAIRRDSPALKVLFTSGFPAPNYRKTVGLDAAVAFVTKPWTASELLGRVRTLLQPAPA